ncbi:MAG: formylglycine-generating enzyme family protein [Gemmataceae bacterium]
MTRITAVAAAFCLAAGLGWFLLAPGPAPDGMVWVPGGWFVMGSDDFDDARPAHRCWVDGFYMDATEVTNAQFARFVAATGYRTVAEQTPTAEQFPGVEAEKLKPFSLVFLPPAVCPPEGCANCDQWWKVSHGADWRHPSGPDSSIDGKDDHPAVHVSFDDAVAYCKWAKKRLPTEAEWERAARGDRDGGRYYWGDELRPGGKWMANTYQGEFPSKDTADDGFAGPAPVRSYPPNAFGLYDLSGNVWEWCSDWYRQGFSDFEPNRTRVNPAGPRGSEDTHGRAEPKRVLRGGSFLCADVYCRRYMAGGRQQGEPTTGQSHTGFRCVLSPKDR